MSSQDHSSKLPRKQSHLKSYQKLPEAPERPHWLYSEEFYQRCIEAASDAAERPPSDLRIGQLRDPSVGVLRKDGGALSNTPPSNRIPDYRPGHVPGGVDKLEVVGYGQVTEEHGLHHEAMLRCKQKAGETGQDAEYEIVGAKVYVAKKGFYWGPSSMPLKFTCEGITFGVARIGTLEEYPLVKVQIGSLALMTLGHWRCWERAQEILRQLGIHLNRTTVFRIDICVDLPCVDSAAFGRNHQGGKSIGRFTDFSTHPSQEGTPTGLSCYTKTQLVTLRCYDKITELKINARQSESQEKAEQLFIHRWNCSVPQKSARVEFQVRGEYLRGRFQNCNTVEETFERLGSVAQHFCTEYFRQSEKRVDRKNGNQGKTPSGELWSLVEWQFAYWTSLEREPVVRKGKPRMNAPMLIKNLATSARSVLACYERAGNDPEEDLTFLLRLLELELYGTVSGRDETMKHIQRKRKEAEKRGLGGKLEYDEIIQQAGKREVHLFPTFSEQQSDIPF